MRRSQTVAVCSAGGTYHDIIPLFAGMERCLPTNSCGPLLRPCYLVHYCFSGKGSYTIHRTGEHFEIGAGQIFIIRPEEVTTYKANPDDPWVYTWVAFRGKLAENFSLLPAVCDYPADTFHRLTEGIAKQIDSAEYYASIIYEMMHCLLFEVQQPMDAPAQVRRYIEYNFMEDLSVEALAQRFNMNRRYLSRIYKAKYGRTIKETIVIKRMDRARLLLMDGYSVGETAVLCGYRDVFNFSKMFHKYHGEVPSAYKKNP